MRDCYLRIGMWRVTKRGRLFEFKMALKMQTFDENEYHIRSALSTTGIPTEYHRNPNWVPQESQLSTTGIPTEYHRTVFCVLLMSNAITFGKWIHSRASSQVGKSWLWPTIITYERRGNLPVEHLEILVKCLKYFASPWFARKERQIFLPFATAQQIVLILCSVSLSVVLRPHSDAT